MPCSTAFLRIKISMNAYDAAQILGIGPKASQHDIRAAYLKLVKKYHPDRYQSFTEQAWATRKFIAIKEAHDFLIAMATDLADTTNTILSSAPNNEDFNDPPRTRSSMDWFFNKLPKNSILGEFIGLLLLPMFFPLLLFGLFNVPLQNYVSKKWNISPSISSDKKSDRIVSLIISSFSAMLSLPLSYWLIFTQGGRSNITHWRIAVGIYMSILLVLILISEWVSFFLTDIWRRSIQSEIKKYAVMQYNK